MRVVIQKSGYAKVEVDGKVVGEISGGLVILLGIKHGDTEKDVDALVEKIINLRLFEEGERTARARSEGEESGSASSEPSELYQEKKYFEKSLLDKKLQALVISQFTLYAGCDKGRRPDFIEAAKGEEAKPLYEKFIQKMQEKGVEVSAGIFGAMMNITLTNQGPVTIILEHASKASVL